MVGVSVFVNADGSPGLFENGLRQNVLFLYQMFRASPLCARVYLLNHGEAELAVDPASLGIDAADIVQTRDVLEQLDFVLAAGAAMEPDLLRRLRARGCKVIAYKGGNGAVISMEAMVARPPRADAERYFDHDCYDAVWLTPQHWATYRGWCETIYRCAVSQVPQVWSPQVLQAAAPAGFGYQPGRRPWRVGIMDPNITVMKTSHMPMLVCEAAFRQAPDAFAAVFVSNGAAHRDNPHFASFTTTLTAAQAGVMTLEPRFVGAAFIAEHCDAVVTHQWENGLNYLYYEALFGGYPLVHNSPFLADHGYYYPDFDAEAGGAALLKAVAEHDDGLADYRMRSAALLESLDARSARSIERHETLLFSLRD